MAFEAVPQARKWMLLRDSPQDKVDGEHIARETASKLEQGETTLIAVIESIGDYVKDEDSTIRSKSLHYLAEILNHLSHKVLSRQQVDVLCTFLVNRIEDGGAVEGLLALQANPRFTKDMAVTVTRTVIQKPQDAQPRSQLRRHAFARLVHELLANHRDAIRTIENEFLVGIIDLFGGEKDPRNLMLVFSVVYVVAMEWELGTHVEDLFESLFCYFPITFRPPPNDPYRITAQDLKQRLRRCMAASSKFAQFSIPLLLEKLDSGSPNVKRDVFETLLACIESYDAQTIAKYSVKLWESLKYEVFHAQEEDLAEEALKVIQADCAKLCLELPSSGEGKIFVEKYLATISKDCLAKMQEPQHKQAKYASDILAALAKTSHRACDEVIKNVFPSLSSLYQGAETIETRRSFLECFLIILEAAVEVSHAHPRPNAVDQPLAKFKDTLLEKFSQALMATAPEEISYRLLALSCLAKLSNIAGVLSSEEVGLPVQHFNDIMLSEDIDQRPDLANKAIDTLLELAESKYQVILLLTIPRLLTELPDAGSTDVKKYQRSISILARLSTHPQLADTIFRRLFSRLETALRHTAPPQYCEALLVALTYAIQSQKSAHTFDAGKYTQNAVDLVKQCGEVAVSGQPHPLGNINVMKAVGRLVRPIIRRLPEADRERFWQQAYTLFTDRSIIDHDDSADKSRRQSIILSTYILAAIDGKSAIPQGFSTSQTPMLDGLVSKTLSSDEPEIQMAFLQHLSLLVNKFSSKDDLTKALDICKQIGVRESQNTTGIRTVKVLMYLAKGQILRMSNTGPLLDHLFTLLLSDSIGIFVARGFEVLLSKDELLTRENGAKIRLLSGQVIFTQLLEHIRKYFPSSTPQARSNHLIALGGVLKHINQELALSHMKELMPLLLQSLGIPDVSLKKAVVGVLAVAISQSPSSVEDYLSSIVPQLLTIAISRETNEAPLRLESMKCLALAPGRFKEFLLIPQAKIVDQGVVKVLSDPRRDVRKAAVDCRAAWLAMDEPNDDD